MKYSIILLFFLVGVATSQEKPFASNIETPCDNDRLKYLVNHSNLTNLEQNELDSLRLLCNEYLDDKMGNTSSPRISAFGIGMSIISPDTKNSSNVGLCISFTFTNFYMDFALNGAKGKGEFLNYTTEETYLSDNIAWYVFNFGYNIFFNDNCTWITPIVGLGMIQPIYNDPLGFDTYYYGDMEIIPTIGVNIAQKISHSIILHAGISTFEICKLQIGFAL